VWLEDSFVDGHEVVLHGRNRDRAQQALRAVPGARTALEGDVGSMEQTRELVSSSLDDAVIGLLAAAATFAALWILRIALQSRRSN